MFALTMIQTTHTEKNIVEDNYQLNLKYQL